ncbi:hypothetical protein KIW84_045547 [Lathyrus oleraceus]|uniref:Uncharacterized protein n=1 Tax=Pisum sativum TaxID=3888 RepID=A0A9D4XNF2_PEA|nr:hypothetical protein KIW84_045547 [Pisum sativum]
MNKRHKQLSEQQEGTSTLTSSQQKKKVMVEAEENNGNVINNKPPLAGSMPCHNSPSFHSKATTLGMDLKKNVLSKKQRSNAASTYKNQIPFDDSRFLEAEQEGRPKSHTSTFTLDTASLIFHLVNGRHVDTNHIIDDKLKMVVESGRQPGTKPSFPLVYPGLIMGLCMSTHMVLPPHVHETITRPIEDANISNYCTSRRTRETRQASAKTTNRGFSDWDPRMRFAGFYV